MKKYILIGLVSLPALVFAQGIKGKRYTVRGSVGNFNAPAMMYLNYETLEGKAFVDSVVLKNGKFQFTGTCAKDCPQRADLTFNKNGTGRLLAKGFAVIFLEPGIITVNGNDTTLINAAVAGTQTNLDFARFQLAMKPFQDAESALLAKRMAASDEERNSEAFQTDHTERVMAIRAQMGIALKKFIQDNPGLFINLEIIKGLSYHLAYAEVTRLFNGLTPAVKGTADGKKLAERLSVLNTLALGAMAPEFTTADTSGKMVSLSSFRGKYVLIDFWASYCIPCRAENPHLVKLFNRYKNQNFTIIGVSLDYRKDAWLKAIHKDGLPWIQLSDLTGDNSKTWALFNTPGVPSNFLLDPGGKIIAQNLRGEELETKLAEIFGKK